MIYDSDPRLQREEPARPSALLRILTIVAASLALVLALGTIVAFATGARQKRLERSAAAAALPQGGAIFTGIGTIRAATLDAKPAVIVATIAFPYDGSDRAFSEELQRSAPALKAAAMGWFSRRKAAELVPAYEGGIKAALRDTFNSLLSLGKVNEIWLSDFSVVQ